MRHADTDLAAQVFEESGARMIGDGIPYPDLVGLQARVREWPQWFQAWRELAEDYEQRGDEALAQGFPITAGESYWHACMSWHYGQFLWFQAPQEREHGQRQKVALYRRAAPLLRPPAERVDIPFEGTAIPGDLRLPEGEPGPPCVVLLGGLESTKEESYLFENLCLARGLATFAFDGPGQGEYFFQRPMVPDFERYASAVVDYLETRAEIDSARLGVLGRSLGGYYAVRSAALEPRFKACVAFGALYDLSYWDQIEPLTQRGLRYVTGVSDADEAESTAKRCVDLAGVSEQLHAPLYILHGAKDALIPVSQAHRLERSAVNADKTVVIEPEGNHCGHNIHSRVRPPMADWLARRLGASGYRPSR